MGRGWLADTTRQAEPLADWLIVSGSRVILTVMGYEAVRGHSRRGRVGGSYVRGSVRFTDRRAPQRPGRYRSPYFHGYRSASSTPIWWGLAAFFGVPTLVLVVLVLTHIGSPDRPADNSVVPSTTAPAQPTAPPKSCFPFNC